MRCHRLIICILLFGSPLLDAQTQSVVPSIPFQQRAVSITPHDPTQPYSMLSQETVTGRLGLQLTLVGKTRRIALINGTFVQVGDTIGTAKILDIEDGYVVLVDSGHLQTLYLFETVIRK